MFRFFAFIVFFSTFINCYSQPLSYYAIPNLPIKVNFEDGSLSAMSPKFRAEMGLNGGVLYKNFGLGIGVETCKIFSDIKSGYPVYVEARYFANRVHSRNNLIIPRLFIGLGAGNFIWNANNLPGSFSTPSLYNFNITSFYKGRSFYSCEIGVRLSKNHRKHGVLISLCYRKLSGEEQINRLTYVNIAGILQLDDAEVLSIKRLDFNEVGLKLGYKF
jgi:hypothetical protein